MTGLSRIGRLRLWLSELSPSLTAKVTSVHVLVASALGYAWWLGWLQRVFIAAGVFAWGVAALAMIHAVVATTAAHRHDAGHPMVGDRSLLWMGWLESAMLAFGFLGTCWGAIVELTSVDPTLKGDALVQMLRDVLQGVGIAVYSTLIGAAANLWASAVTNLLSEDR